MKLSYSDKLALIREYRNQGGKGSYLSLLQSYPEGGNLPKNKQEKETIPLVSNYYNTSLAQPIDGINDNFRSMIIGDKVADDPKLSPQEYLYSVMTSPKYRELYLDNYYSARQDRSPDIYNDSTITKEMVEKDTQVAERIKNTLEPVTNSKITIDNSGNTNYNYKRGDIHVSSDLDAIPHELAHSIPEGEFDLSPMYVSMFDKYIPTDDHQSRLKEIIGSKKYRNTLEKASDIRDITRLNYKVSSGTHDITPAEVRSDIYDLRYKLYKSGVHDFRKDTFDSKSYEKALKQSKGTILERLFKAYSKEDLIELMNTVVDNKNNNDKTRQIS